MQQPDFLQETGHITPLLMTLHWLPITFRIDFKALLDLALHYTFKLLFLNQCAASDPQADPVNSR